MDLMIKCGSWYIPNPSKTRPNGDDCHFYSTHRKIFAVADGVGSYIRGNVDPGVYARELMHNAFDAVENLYEDLQVGDDENIPLKVMKKAFNKTTAQGGSTACVISLKGQDICAANIGDSSFVVVRSGRVIYHSPEQNHGFNCPFHLATTKHSTPKDAQTLYFKNVKEGDVIVAGTDGLFDNLFDKEIAFAVTHAMKNRIRSQSIAQLLACLALRVSKDEYRESPFSVKKRKARRIVSSGGKVDDITVIVAKVVRSVKEKLTAGAYLSGVARGGGPKCRKRKRGSSRDDCRMAKTMRLALGFMGLCACPGRLHTN